MLESGKKSAQALGQVSGKMAEDQTNLAGMETEKAALQSRLLEITGDLQVITLTLTLTLTLTVALTLTRLLEITRNLLSEIVARGKP